MSADSNDYVGHSNLEIVSGNHRFNNWLYRQVNQSLRQGKENILEVGSGLGTLSEKIIQEMSPWANIILTDISVRYVDSLKERYSLNKNVNVHKMDLNDEEDCRRIRNEEFDTIIAVNVLEHVKDDYLAFRELYRMLKEGGSLVVLVPSHKFLFNIIDMNVGHYRRYSKEELLEKTQLTGFKPEHIFYFNMLGIVGWYFNGSIFKKASISHTASKLFDRLVPVMDYLERITRKKVGLSLICYLKK